MKSSDCTTEPRLAIDTLMRKHDTRRSYQVDWRSTKIRRGGFFGRDNNDPIREISRIERRRRSDGRSVVFDDIAELVDLFSDLMNQKKRSRSYINDGACGKACDFKHGRSRAQAMGAAMRRNGSLGAHRSFGY